MPDWLIGSLFVYGVVAFLVLFIPLANMPSNGDYCRYRRQNLARVALTAPIWPLWIPAFIAYGIYRLIQIARTGE